MAGPMVSCGAPRHAVFRLMAKDISPAYAYMRVKGVEPVVEIVDGVFFNFQDRDGNLLMVADVPLAPRS